MNINNIIRKTVSEALDDLGFKHDNQIDAFTTDALRHVNGLRKVIERLPNKGNRCENSQKVCIMHSIIQIERLIESLTDDDFIDHDSNY